MVVFCDKRFQTLKNVEIEIEFADQGVVSVYI